MGGHTLKLLIPSCFTLCPQELTAPGPPPSQLSRPGSQRRPPPPILSPRAILNYSSQAMSPSSSLGLLSPAHLTLAFGGEGGGDC